MDAIYSTNYFRTLETVNPISKDNLEIQIYNPFVINYKEFIETNKGKTVLVVGHSNTIPTFTNELLEEDYYKDIEDDNNSNLYFINICNEQDFFHALYYVN